MAGLQLAWLHAIEDDRAVRSHPLQLARVLADFGGRRADGRVHVSWRRLQRCTHQSNGTLSRSLALLEKAGYLATLPHGRGERAWRVFRFPEKPRPSQEHSVENMPLPSREHSAAVTGAEPRRPREHERKRMKRNARMRETEPTRADIPMTLLCGRCGSDSHRPAQCPY